MLKIPVLLLLIAALLLAGQCGYEESNQAEQSYCASVRAGLHPDYKGIYDEVCR